MLTMIGKKDLSADMGAPPYSIVLERSAADCALHALRSFSASPKVLARALVVVANLATSHHSGGGSGPSFDNSNSGGGGGEIRSEADARRLYLLEKQNAAGLVVAVLKAHGRPGRPRAA